MTQGVKNTENTVILVSSGTISGGRSRQVAQSELYARALARFGGSMLLDGGFGSAETLAERTDALLLSGGGDIHPAYYGRHLTGKDAATFTATSAQVSYADMERAGYGMNIYVSADVEI